MTPVAYRDLLRIARRHSRRADEAEDLVQDALMAAVVAGRDVSGASSLAWLAGTIRNRAAFVARSAARRGRREHAWQAVGEQATSASSARERLDELLVGLPPATRIVAALAFTGHSRAEIRYLLRLSDTALRQRLSALKRRLRVRGVELPAATPGLSLALDYGRIRDTLMGKLVREGGLFASHDPDGHLFVVRRSQTVRARQQQSGPAARSTP